MMTLVLCWCWTTPSRCYTMYVLVCGFRTNITSLTFGSHPSSASLYPQMSQCYVRAVLTSRVFQELGHCVMVRTGCDHFWSLPFYVIIYKGQRRTISIRGFLSAQMEILANVSERTLVLLKCVKKLNG